jgi:hypothetical protein
MDIFWLEKLKVIFRTALAIMKIRKDEILKVMVIFLNFALGQEFRVCNEDLERL